MATWSWKIFIFTNIILYFLTLGLWISMPDMLTLNISVTAFTFLCSFVLMLRRKGQIERYAKSHHFKKVIETSIVSALLLAILGVINYLAFKNPIQLDMTKGRFNSLTEQSKKLLQSLDKPLEIKIFARKKDSSRLVAIADLYRLEGRDVQVQTIDPDLSPELSRQYEVKASGTIVIEYGGKMARFQGASEKLFSSSIHNLSREKTKKIYFLKGHGEFSIQDEGESGLSEIKKLLQEQYFAVDEVNLLSKENVPSDADILIILGPRTPFLEHEIEKITNYIDKGGKVLAAFSPNFKYFVHENLAKLFLKYGISFENNIVLDTKNHVSGSKGWVPIVSKMDTENIITKSNKLPVFLPFTSSVRKVQSPDEDLLITELAFTNPHPASWAEYNLKDAEKSVFRFDAAIDSQGPIPLIVSSEAPTRKEGAFKIMAFGSGSFVKNAYKNHGGNFTFFLNSISWLAKENFAISYERHDISKKLVILSQPKINLIFYFSVIFCPLILYGIGFYTFRRRQKL